MTRTVPLWEGKTSDTPVPPRVKQRVLIKYNNRCYLSDTEIKPGDEWDVDHITPLALGGLNREDNLAPALKQPHKEKTKSDVNKKKKAARLFNKHHGITKKTGFRTNRTGDLKKKLNGQIVRRDEI